MLIREENSDDIPLIEQIHEDAFGQREESELVDALRLSGDVEISLVAEDADEVVGHILLSKLQAPTQCLALAPVAVLPNRQNQGIGSALIQHGVSLAKAENWLAIFLLGDPTYYERFGFSVDAAAKFETNYPKKYFMALELASNALDKLSGPVTYAPPFDELE